MAPPRRLDETLVAVDGSGYSEQKSEFRVWAAWLSAARCIERYAIGAARHQAILQLPRRVQLVGQQPADQEQDDHHAERDQGAPLAAFRAVAVCHCDVVQWVGRRDITFSTGKV